MVILLNTFLFADLCDYTPYTLAHGDERSAELAVAFHETVRELARREDCQLVKVMGDAVMVRAAEAIQAVRLAAQIHQACADRAYPMVRVGMDTGPAVHAAGDWYGTTVNTAARLAEVAEPGEVLMTERSRAALDRADATQFRQRGTRALKGLPELLLHGARVAMAEGA